MHHLESGDVVQNEAYRLGRVQPRWHRNQFTLREADELRVRTTYWKRGNFLSWLDSGDTVAELIHHTNQIPTGSEGHSRRFGMNALAGHYVGQGDTSG